MQNRVTISSFYLINSSQGFSGIARSPRHRSQFALRDPPGIARCKAMRFLMREVLVLHCFKGSLLPVGSRWNIVGCMKYYISRIAYCDMRYIHYLRCMRKHNGMRPQDIVILLAIISNGKKDWLIKDLASSLNISQSEVSESLNRSQVAGLIDYNKRRVNRHALYEFLQFGLPYVFPVQPGPVVSGVPTAHSHPLLKKKIISEQFYVWPEPGGPVRGFAVEPLYNKQVKAVKENSELYKLLAMVDVLRVGNRRETELAKNILNESILHESSSEHHKD